MEVSQDTNWRSWRPEEGMEVSHHSLQEPLAIQDRNWRSEAEYLSRQIQLLREDFLQPLRLKRDQSQV